MNSSHTPGAPEGELQAVDSAEEIAPEQNDGQDEAEVPAEDLSVEELRQRLDDAEAESKTHWDALLRLQAELENLQKRSKRDVENAHKFGIERFVQELLPVRDSMELGLSAASEPSVDVQSVREGVELTLRMLTSALEKFGIEEIDPQNTAFDPELHQAMSLQEVEGVPAGTVTMVMQKGFKLNGRLVRPALVMVAK